MLAVCLAAICGLAGAYAGARALQTLLNRLPWTAYLDQILPSLMASFFTGLLAWGVQ